MYFIMKNFNPILLYIISSENVLGGGYKSHAGDK